MTIQEAKTDLLEHARTAASRMWPTYLADDEVPHYATKDGTPVTPEKSEASSHREFNPHKLQQGQKSPNAGRLPNYVKYAKQIGIINNYFADNAEEVAKALVARAVGCKAVGKTRDGAEFVYDELPDTKAIGMVLDRLMGKPTEHKQIDKNVNVNGGVRIFMPSNGREKTQAVLQESDIIDAKFHEIRNTGGPKIELPDNGHAAG